MHTVVLQEDEEGVKADPVAGGVAFEELLIDPLLVVLIYEVHADRVQVLNELGMREGAFLLSVELREDCAKLSLGFQVDQAFFESVH